MNTTNKDRSNLSYAITAPTDDVDHDRLETAALQGATKMIVKNRELGYKLLSATWERGTHEDQTYIFVRMKFEPPAPPKAFDYTPTSWTLSDNVPDWVALDTPKAIVPSAYVITEEAA